MIQPVDDPERRAIPTEPVSATTAVEILEAMSDGFVAIDRDWRYTYLNPAAARIVNRRREKMLVRIVWSLFPRRDSIRARMPPCDARMRDGPRDARTDASPSSSRGALKPDVVVMDAPMPELNGLKTTEQVHELSHESKC